MNDPYNPGPEFKLRSRYGQRKDPITGTERKFHSGQDFAAEPGTRIPAATSGVVVYSGFNDNLGHTVIVKNNAGGYSLYAHMQGGASQAQVGQQIWPGGTIGLVGNTGKRTTGYHLHYSVITREALAEREKSAAEMKKPLFDPKGGPLGIALNSATTIDPSSYRVDPYTYAPVPYLDQTLRAERKLFGANDASTAEIPGTPSAPSGPLDELRPQNRNGSFNDRFGNWSSVSSDGTGSSSPPAPAPLRGLAAHFADYMRDQDEADAGKPPASVFDTGAPPVPFIPDDGEGSFADRFGDRPPIRKLSRFIRR